MDSKEMQAWVDDTLAKKVAVNAGQFAMAPEAASVYSDDLSGQEQVAFGD